MYPIARIVLKLTQTRACAFAGARLLVAAALMVSLVLLFLPSHALAISSAKEANEVLDAAETEVTRTANAYDEATAEQERLADQISALNKKIDKLEKELPAQEERSNESCVALYKISSNSFGVVATLLDAESLTEAISFVDSFNHIISQNVEQMNKTAKMKKDLESSRDEVKSAKADADAAASSAAAALESAKQAREQAQKQAEEAQKAEEEAAAKAAAEAEANAKTKAEKKAAQAEAKKESTSSSNASVSHVSWSSGKTAFVNKWAPRINSYLSGSPTAGTGEIYAAAAWNNGVDPRWAPAISCIESSKGAACFASHNAWGYGGSGFGSWSDGINTVVAALGSSMYGGALTKRAAQIYCPPTWQDWYSKVASEMAKI